MTEGVIWKQLLQFAIPMMIGLLFQQFYNTVDTIVVGQFVGKEALAAVGSTGSIINMLVGLCAGLATGASVVISQCYGARDYVRLQDAVHTTIALTFIMCAITTLAGVLLVDPMLMMMATPADVFAEAHEYLTIYFAGVSGLLIYNMGSGIMRAVGDSQRPLYFLVFSALVNIVLDLVFVIVFSLGVAGVAYATIISQFLSALIVLASLTKTDEPYAIHWKSLCMKRDMLKQILAIGLPSGIQQAITAFSNVFVQSYINAFGSACMAGWSSYNKLDIFITIPNQAVSLASTTFTGQNFGAGKLDRAHKGVKSALAMSLIVTCALSVLVIIFARPLLMMFSTESDVLDFGVFFVSIISPFYVLTCFTNIFSGALRGIGVAKTPTFIMLGSFVVFRQLYLLANKLLFGGNFIVMSVAYPVGWLVCSVLLVIFYRRSALCRKQEKVPVPAE